MAKYNKQLKTDFNQLNQYLNNSLPKLGKLIETHSSSSNNTKIQIFQIRKYTLFTGYIHTTILLFDHNDYVEICALTSSGYTSNSSEDKMLKKFVNIMKEYEKSAD